MKRFHVHAHVEDIQASIAFYSRMFAAEPSRVESDYAKLMLDDPRINFAISTRGGKLGVDHLGIQTDTEEELVELEVASFILNLLTSLRQFEEAPSSYPQPYPQLESCRQERVCQSHTGIAEVGCIARHHSQVVDQRWRRPVCQAHAPGAVLAGAPRLARPPHRRQGCSDHTGR